jgi:2-methylcitrate dehydratase PrpD
MKAFHAGYAAKTGMEAVQLLRWGFSARTGVLDEFLNLYGGGEADRSELTRDWGTPWRISKPGLWRKRYPFCSAAAHVRDAAAALAEQVDPEQIAKIEIVYPPHGDAALIHQDPQNGEEGRFSPEYVAALVLRGIPLTFDRFSKDCPADEATRALMKKAVRVHDDSIMPSAEAMPKGRFTILRVWDLNGDLVSARVDAPTGSPAKPLTEEELFGKLKESVGEERAKGIWAKVQGL